MKQYLIKIVHIGANGFLALVQNLVVLELRQLPETVIGTVIQYRHPFASLNFILINRHTKKLSTALIAHIAHLILGKAGGDAIKLVGQGPKKDGETVHQIHAGAPRLKLVLVIHKNVHIGVIGLSVTARNLVAKG